MHSEVQSKTVEFLFVNEDHDPNSNGLTHGGSYRDGIYWLPFYTIIRNLHAGQNESQTIVAVVGVL